MFSTKPSLVSEGNCALRGQNQIVMCIVLSSMDQQGKISNRSLVSIQKV